MNRTFSWRNLFETEAGSLLDFSMSYKRFGLNVNASGDLEYREWAPNARDLSLVIYELYYISSLQFGDFNGWNRDSHKCTRDDFGVWSIILPRNPIDNTLPVPHDSRFKCCITK